VGTQAFEQRLSDLVTHKIKSGAENQPRFFMVCKSNFRLLSARAFHLILLIIAFAATPGALSIFLAHPLAILHAHPLAVLLTHALAFAHALPGTLSHAVLEFHATLSGSFHHPLMVELAVLRALGVSIQVAHGCAVFLQLLLSHQFPSENLVV
jgi:hypothetical protein